MIRVLGIDRTQLNGAKALVFEEYSKAKLAGLSVETLKYLALSEILQEVRRVIGARSFLGYRMCYGKRGKSSNMELP